MRFYRFLKLASATLMAVGLSCVSVAPQTSTNSTSNTQGMPVVVPPTGDGKIIGSTIPASAMPREEPLGDAARRVRKKKKKNRKAHHRRTTAPKPRRPQL